MKGVREAILALAVLLLCLPLTAVAREAVHSDAGSSAGSSDVYAGYQTRSPAVSDSHSLHRRKPLTIHHKTYANAKAFRARRLAEDLAHRRATRHTSATSHYRAKRTRQHVVAGHPSRSSTHYTTTHAYVVHNPRYRHQAALPHAGAQLRRRQLSARDLAEQLAHRRSVYVPRSLYDRNYFDRNYRPYQHDSSYFDRNYRFDTHDLYGFRLHGHRRLSHRRYHRYHRHHSHFRPIQPPIYDYGRGYGGYFSQYGRFGYGGHPGFYGRGGYCPTPFGYGSYGRGGGVSYYFHF